MTKKYLIEQIHRVYKMIEEQQSLANIKRLKIGKKKEMDFEMTKELRYIQYKYNKHRKLESATKKTLLSLLDEYVNYGFINKVKGFDTNFIY